MEKYQVLLQGLQQLNDHARNSLGLSINENMFELTAPDVKKPDAVKLILSKAPGLSYTIHVQPWAPQKDFNALLSQLKSMSANTVLFANFVNPVMARKFNRRSISYVDCAGNLSLKIEQCKLYARGKKPSGLRVKRMRGRAFNSTGLKLIFAIFNNPDLLHATYREISTKVNIALGSVGPVMDDLFNSGYILDDGQRQLVNKKRLFERWVDGYLEKLRPKQILSCYRSDVEGWWKDADPDKFNGLWGGDVFIARSTPFMLPETTSLYFYTDDAQKKFVDYYGLKSDDEGDICIYKAFWSNTLAGSKKISPMVMYADIVDSINPGSWDVAKTFYGEAVADLLRD